MTTDFIPYSGPVVTRDEARVSGLKRYFPGKPCIHGHLAEWLYSTRACSECNRLNKAKHLAANMESEAARKAAYRAANLEMIRAREAAWQKSNPDKVRAKEASRRARIMNAEGFYTTDDVNRIMVGQKRKCAYCRVRLNDGYHIDHIVALSRGGSNWPKNIQLTCQKCNCRKHARRAEEFARSLGKLV